MNQTFCPACNFAISESFYFCPNCGKKIKEAPTVLTVGRKIGIYALSIFLPPLGLWPGIKYVMQKDEKIKTVGAIAIILTVISIIINIWISFGIYSFVNGLINSQLSQYQPPGI